MGTLTVSLQFTRIVVDENVPREVVDMLKRLGFKDVYWVPEHRQGMGDREIWLLAASRQAYLLVGDIGYFKQLDENETLNGPDMLEYSTNGFAKSELQDPTVMRMLVEWFFTNGHHTGKQYARIRIEGSVKTRRQVWQREKAHREGHI